MTLLVFLIFPFLSRSNMLYFFVSAKYRLEPLIEKKPLE